MRTEGVAPGQVEAALVRIADDALTDDLSINHYIVSEH
jgi:hypothetical protein